MKSIVLFTREDGNLRSGFRPRLGLLGRVTMSILQQGIYKIIEVLINPHRPIRKLQTALARGGGGGLLYGTDGDARRKF